MLNEISQFGWLVGLEVVFNRTCALELCALFNNFRKMMGKHKAPFEEQDFNKGMGAFYNQARGTKTIRDGVGLGHKTLDSQNRTDEWMGWNGMNQTPQAVWKTKLTTRQRTLIWIV